MRLGFLVGLFAVFAATAAAAAAPPYAVIFEVTRSADGNVGELKVSKVIDPTTGSTDAVDIAIPAVYIERARQKVKASAVSRAKLHYFTYFLFDPRDPENVEIGVSK